MKKINWLHILNGIMEFSYLGVVFLVPVYFAFLFTGYNVFELNKAVLFNLLTSLFLVCFAVKYLFCPGIVKQNLSKRKLKYLAIPLFFLVSMAVSAVFSDFRKLSFFGLYGRQQGVLDFIYYFIFFALLVIYIKEEIQIKRILNVIGISSFLVAGYGILQALGWDLLNWTEDTSMTGRVISSLGQPNFLGSFLLLVMPMVWYLFYTAKKGIVKFWWPAVLLLQIVCLYFTFSRGAYLGLIAGAIAGFVLYFIFVSRYKFKPVKAVLSLLILLLFLSTILFFFASEQKIVRRWSQGIDFEQGSVAFRLDLWEKAGQAIQEAPVFGYGPDTQKEIFSKYYQKDWGVLADVNTVPSRAHNFILDKLLTTGILGLLAYLAVLYLFIKYLFNILKNAEQSKDGSLNKKIFALAILIAIVSYFTSLLFHFHTVATQVYFWLYLALALIVYDLQENESEKASLFRAGKKRLYTIVKNWSFFLRRRGEVKKGRTLLILKILTIFILIAGFGLHFKKQIDHLVADHYYAYMNLAYNQKDFFRIFELYDHIEQSNVRERHYDREAVLMISEFIDNADSEHYKRVGFAQVKPALEKLKFSPGFQDAYAQAKAYSALADKNHQDYFRMAEEKFRKLIKESPEKPKNYISYGRMLAKEGRNKEALAVYDKALRLLPPLNDPRLNKKHAQAIKKEKYFIHKGRAEAYYSQEKFSQAEDCYRRALVSRPSDVFLYKKIANTYYEREDLEKAIEYNKKGYLLNEENPVWPFSIALIYKESGNKKRALIYAEKALELSPDNKQFKKFVNELK